MATPGNLRLETETLPNGDTWKVWRDDCAECGATLNVQSTGAHYADGTLLPDPEPQRRWCVRCGSKLMIAAARRAGQ